MFKIIKAYRSANSSPYSGPSCEKVGVTPGLVYPDRESAQKDADKLATVNPVGFKVVEVFEPVTIRYSISG